MRAGPFESRWAAVLGVVVATLVVGTSPAVTFEGESGCGDVDAYTEAATERIEQSLARYRVPGAAVALVCQGAVVWVEGFGVTDHRDGEPVDPDRTVFLAGSISKSLTAWGVLRLVERGELSLDDPVERHLGDLWPAGGVGARPVTARLLLSHTAGLPFTVFDDDDTSRARELLERRPDAFRLEGEPGQGFRYSNPGFGLVEVLVEEVGGRSFDELMADEVLEPLGMGRSGFGWQDRFTAHAATGHTLDGVPIPPEQPALLAAGGLRTTAADLARFVAASARGGVAVDGARVLDAASVESMQAPIVATAGLPATVLSDGYGLGHFAETLPAGHRAVMHGGQNTGFLSGYYVVPETGDGVLLLTNSERSWPLLVSEARSWAEWRGFGAMRAAELHGMVGTVLLVTTIGFGALTLALTAVLLHGIVTGRRRTSGTGRRRIVGRVLLTVAAGALIVAWFGFAAGALRPLFPLRVPQMGAAVAALSSVLALLALLPRSSRVRPGPP